MRVFFLSLCVACCALAGPIRGPQEVTVAVGRLQEVPLVVDGDDVQYLILGGDYFGGFREFSDPKTFKFQVLGYQEGAGWIVVGIVKDGKIQPLYSVRVTVGKGPKPPVPPNPDPPPLPPDDPDVVALAAQIKVSATVDKWSPDSLTLCAQAHRDAAKATRAVALSDNRAAMLEAIKGAMKGQQIAPTVKATISEFLDAAFPARAASYVFTAADVATVQTRLEKIAKACERAAK